MKVIIISMVFIAAGCAVADESGKQNYAGAMLEKGIYQEETVGDVNAAIEIYQKIIEDEKARRPDAAKATYRAAMCYTKKGETEKAQSLLKDVVLKFADQRAVAEKARKELKGESGDDILKKLAEYGFGQHKEQYLRAKGMGIKANTIVYVVNEDCQLIQASLVAVENESNKPLEGEIALGNCGSEDIMLVDEKLEAQKVRIEDSGGSIGKYRIFWTPEKPLAPGEIKVLAIKMGREERLGLDKGYELEMSNYFGQEVLESFVLVVPTTVRISGTDKIDMHQRMGNYDVYCWQDRVSANTTHKKTVKLEIKQQYAESLKPAVIESFPKTYANDVDPCTTQIWVKFDQDMFTHGWSWCQVAGQEYYPRVKDSTGFKDSRTCALNVELDPARAYLIVINAAPYEGFRSNDEIPAKPFAIVFATKDAAGNATSIPAELLKKAQEINAKYKTPEPLLDTIPQSVKAFVANKFYATWERAQAKKLWTNSHVHIIDGEFNRNFGGMQVYHNKSSSVLDYEVSMASFDNPEVYVFDQEGTKQKTRAVKKPMSNYRIYWTPSKPLGPMETRVLVWMQPATRKLSADAGGNAKLVMRNHFGDAVIENFYIVMPTNLKLISATEEFTSHDIVDNMHVYCWSKEQTFGQDHRVEVSIGKN